MDENSPISATSLDMNFFGLCYGGYNYISLLRSGLSWNYASNNSEFNQFIDEIKSTTESGLHYNTWKVRDFIPSYGFLKNPRNKK